MNELEKIIDQICLELDTAEDYAYSAIHNTNMSIKDTYVSLAKDELEHVDKLNMIADKLSLPEKDKSVWDWYHKKSVKQLALIKELLITA